MGTPDFAVPTLKALIDSAYEVVAVFTQPDKPRGRHGEPAPTPVKEEALRADIPVYQPKRIREPENLELLQRLDPDVIVVAAFGQIIPKSILELPKYGCINVHASLLPAYRGAAPIQWAVINGDAVSGVTTMQMGEGLDTGDMLCKVEVPLAEDETGGSLFDKLADAGAKLLLDTLQKLEAGEVIPEKQPEESTTPYAAMLTKQMGNIDWSKRAVEIERLVRGLNPWPSAYTFLGKKQMKIWEASVDARRTDAAPGTIVQCDGSVIGVATGDGILLIRSLQMEGKKRMDAAAFLRGYALEEGSKFASARA